MPHRAWLVDLDGTLYHPLPLKLAMGALLALTGVHDLRVIRAFRAQHEQVRSESRRGAGASGAADPFRRQLELAAEELGLGIDAIETVVHEWMIRRPSPWLRRFRRRGILEELRAFRAQGGRTALVSDYPASEKLHALGAAELFDTVVASGEAGGPAQLKPDPEGYLLAARLLGVEPSQCLVLGDRRDADGAAAQRAGMAYRHIG